MDPVVCLISSYMESTLIQGAIRSAQLANVDKVIVYDGPTIRERVIEGEPTNLGEYFGYERSVCRGAVDFVTGVWYEGEAAKRTKMLRRAEKLLPVPFWILTLDADEILVWGEYLRDWLGQLRPDEGEVVVPLKRTEAAWDPERGFVSDISPSRLVHSSIVDRYLVSCWRILTPENMIFEASHYRADRQPMYGEPHIHHRHYLRRPDRAGIREHEAEELAATEAMRSLADVIPSPDLLEDILFPPPEERNGG